MCRSSTVYIPHFAAWYAFVITATRVIFFFFPRGEYEVPYFLLAMQNDEKRKEKKRNLLLCGFHSARKSPTCRFVTEDRSIRSATEAAIGRNRVNRKICDAYSALLRQVRNWSMLLILDILYISRVEKRIRAHCASTVAANVLRHAYETLESSKNLIKQIVSVVTIVRSVYSSAVDSKWVDQSSRKYLSKYR